MSVAVPPRSAAGAHSRGLWLHVPAGYVSNDLTPLVLVFHGAGGTGLGMQRLTGLSALGDRGSRLVAYPQGLGQTDRHIAGWAASGPLDPPAHGIDDGLFVSDLLNELQARYCVDPNRIAAAGFSNGGGLVGYLACVMSRRIAAFAAVEGEFFAIPGGCRPAGPASILDVHAVTDPIAPYAGVPARGSPDFSAPAIPTWLAQWALRDGCRHRQTGRLSRPVQTQESWTGCAGRAVVAGYRLARGGHVWPRSLGTAAGSETLLDFFAAHPLSQPSGGWRPHAGVIVPSLAGRAPAVSSIRQFRVPTPGAEPLDVASGPGGTVWFTEFDADKIGRINPSGAIREFRVPTPKAGPYQLAVGPDGAMWFTEYNTVKLGRVSPSGDVTEITLERRSAGGLGITSTPAGPLWVADPAGDVDRITARRRITMIPTGPGATPFAVARAGADVWFSEFTGYFEHSRWIAAIDPTGRLHKLVLRNPASDVDALAADPTGRLWFTDYGSGRIGVIAASGQMRSFADPSPYGGLNDIASGPDHAMWYTEQSGIVGRVTLAGKFSQLALAPGSAPNGITQGAGGTLWIAETAADKIVRITLR